MVENLPNVILDAPTADGGNRPHDQVKAANDDGHLKSRVVKRSIIIDGHRTSISLEDVFWNEFRSISQERHVPMSKLVGEIDTGRTHTNLSSAIRLFVFENRCDLTGGGRHQNEPLNGIPQISPTSTSEKR